MCSNKKNVVEKVGHGLFNFSKNKDEHGTDPGLIAAWEELAKYATFLILLSPTLNISRFLRLVIDAYS